MDRRKLIRQAMAVHKAKQKILADLSDDQRRKLMLTAMRTLLNEGKDDAGPDVAPKDPPARPPSR